MIGHFAISIDASFLNYRMEIHVSEFAEFVGNRADESL